MRIRAVRERIMHSNSAFPFEETKSPTSNVAFALCARTLVWAEYAPRFTQPRREMVKKRRVAPITPRGNPRVVIQTKAPALSVQRIKARLNRDAADIPRRVTVIET